MQLGLLITQRCNAACTHCSTSCGPDKTTSLAPEKIKRLMDEAAGIRDGRPLVFSISGGEPFLAFQQLLEIVSHGAGLGAQVTCVTNGYWASSDEKADSLLESLKRAGLTALGVSTSRFHRRFVRIERVRRALGMAVAKGIGTVLKYAATPAEQQDAEKLEAWAKSIGVKRVEIFSLLPYIREGERLPDSDFVPTQGLPKGRCPNPSLTVREDGTAYSCCTPGGFVDFLSLGKVRDGALRNAYRRYLLQGKQNLLRERGPMHFARGIQRRGLGHLLKGSYAGVCDLCAHIASDPALSAAADEIAASYEIQMPPLAREVLKLAEAST